MRRNGNRGSFSVAGQHTLDNLHERVGSGKDVNFCCSLMYKKRFG